jgi:catechol 2,3-dioxygenase-like lactoylglutathione lyase family enzyme
MELGAFSISLTVKDLAASKAFYEALGFNAMGGDESAGWLILRQGSTIVRPASLRARDTQTRGASVTGPSTTGGRGVVSTWRRNTSGRL